MARVLEARYEDGRVYKPACEGVNVAGAGKDGGQRRGCDRDVQQGGAADISADGRKDNGGIERLLEDARGGVEGQHI